MDSDKYMERQDLQSLATADVQLDCEASLSNNHDL
jgi:hypothetical protein